MTDTAATYERGFVGESDYKPRVAARHGCHLLKCVSLWITITYDEFTIDDPTVWTKPWTASIPMTRTDLRLYEYACHEGNYDFGFILSGARNLEKDAAVKTGSQGNPR